MKPFDYGMHFKAMQTKWNHQQKKLDFFKANAKTLGLGKVETCISIGAGMGDLDAFLVRECMPNLKRYYGEEPDHRLRGLLEEKMNAPELSPLEVKTYSEPAEVWEGPGEKVDAVFVIFCLLLMDERQTVLKKCVDWLKPGGILIVASNTQSFYVQASRLFDAEPEQVLPKDILHQDFDSVGLREFQEYTFTMECWVEDGNEHFFAVVFNREPADEKEMETFYEFRRRHAPGTIVAQNTVLRWQKDTDTMQSDAEKERDRVDEIRRTVISHDVRPEDMVQVYNTWAATYEQDIKGRHGADVMNCQKSAADVMASLFDHEGRSLGEVKILDLACGTGLVGVELQKKGFHQLDGLDCSLQMLEKAQEKSIYGQLICDTMGKNKLDICDNAYDGNVCINSIVPGHVNGDCFEELVRITKPGGFCVFTVSEDYFHGDFKDSIERQILELSDKGFWREVIRRKQPPCPHGHTALLFVYQPVDIKV